LFVTPAAALHAAQLWSTKVIHFTSIFLLCAGCVFLVGAVIAFGPVDLGLFPADIVWPGSLILFLFNQSVIQWLLLQGLPDPLRQLLNAVSRIGSCIAGLDGRRASEPDAA
jgi:hypothetical protein